eukprot:GHVH01003840.1.p1 GENE.GHVH01003840.1~~GHVH01003840.1.p1  ORF type:complete len:365 (+),score=37.92 GHVH01003840.1:64-1158(+)
MTSRRRKCVLVIGGSEAYSGAPIITSTACLRYGLNVDLLTFKEAKESVVAQLDTKYALVETPYGWSYPSVQLITPLSIANMNDIEIECDRVCELINKMSYYGVCIGPGLGPSELVACFVVQLCKKLTNARCNCPTLVIDADGIRAFHLTQKKLSDLGPLRMPIILTPNHIEMNMLIDGGVIDCDLSTIVTCKEDDLNSKEYHFPSNLSIYRKNSEDEFLFKDDAEVWNRVVIANKNYDQSVRVCGQGDMLCGILLSTLTKRSMSSSNKGADVLNVIHCPSDVYVLLCEVSRVMRKHCNDAMQKVHKRADQHKFMEMQRALNCVKCSQTMRMGRSVNIMNILSEIESDQVINEYSYEPRDDEVSN